MSLKEAPTYLTTNFSTKTRYRWDLEDEAATRIALTKDLPSFGGLITSHIITIEQALELFHASTENNLDYDMRSDYNPANNERTSTIVIGRWTKSQTPDEDMEVSFVGLKKITFNHSTKKVSYTNLDEEEGKKIPEILVHHLEKGFGEKHPAWSTHALALWEIGIRPKVVSS